MLQVELRLEHLDSSASGESARLGVHIESRLKQPALARFSIEMLDDRGQEVRPAIISEVKSLGAKGKGFRESFDTPKGLADGHYQVRVTAVALGREDGASEQAQVYLRVRDGQIAPLTTQEWIAESRVTIANESPEATPTISGPVYCNSCEPCTDCDPEPTSSGTVVGRLQFWNKRGLFCPNTADCSGSLYPQYQFDTMLPLRETRVLVRRASDNSIIGSGTTDSNGNFTVSWSTPGTVSGVNAYLVWNAAHKDGRFMLTDPSGVRYNLRTGNIAWLQSGVTTNIPWSVTSWGSSAAPNDIANLYDGAWRSWQALRQSNRMLAYFTGLDIRAFTVPSSCNTSCAVGAENRVYIVAPNRAYSSTVLHEMGHIASYKSSRDQNFRSGVNYCWPNTEPSGSEVCDHSYETVEWDAAAFEEGVANFFATLSLFNSNARAPHICNISQASCQTANAGSAVEPSSGIPYTSASSYPKRCTEYEARQSISTTRYLWDAYDSQVDFPEENLQRGAWEFFDTIHAFPNGRSYGDKDEPWCCFVSCWICSYDARSADNFREHWLTWGTNSYNAWYLNCAPGTGP
jgi:hypothetical protein